MRIGIFDSGLGGLIVTEAIARRLSIYDFVYLGDTARVPYGDRSQEAIYRFTRAAVDHLFRQLDCGLVILACNTASAEALRRLQQEYLPESFPDRRILGVIIPTIEMVGDDKRIGILATRSTVRSNTFPNEFVRRGKRATIVQQAAPLLVPLIENNGLRWAEAIVESYLAPLLASGIQELILGCTHYGAALSLIERMVPDVKVWAQEAIIPDKLVDYLNRHPEIERSLTRTSSRDYYLTDLLDHYSDLAFELTASRPPFKECYLAV